MIITCRYVCPTNEGRWSVQDVSSYTCIWSPHHADVFVVFVAPNRVLIPLVKIRSRMLPFPHVRLGIIKVPMEPSECDACASSERVADSVDLTHTGRCLWFDVRKGIGFVANDADGVSHFVHQSNIVSDGVRKLLENEKARSSGFRCACASVPHARTTGSIPRRDGRAG